MIFWILSSEAAMYAEHLIDVRRRQLKENQVASREHTAAHRRNWAVRRDSSFAEISPPSLPKGWIGFHASGPSERLETSITSTACAGL